MDVFAATLDSFGFRERHHARARALLATVLANPHDAHVEPLPVGRPDDATYDDMMRELYERQAIERGLADSDADRVKDVKDVRAKYGLPE